MKTLVPTVGTTPTFTRATTKTGTNYDGQVFTGLSNEPIFEGARRVENLLTASEDMTNAAYLTGLGAVIDSATQATFDGTTAGYILQQHTITDDGSGAGGRTFVLSADVRVVSGSITSDSSAYIVLGGPAISNATVNIGSEIGATSSRFSVRADTDASGTVINANFYCDDAVTLEITNWQLEETTANSDTSIPSEYVSTGADHGANIDGVQYFLQTNPNTVNGGVVTSDEAHWLELDGTAGNYASTPDSAAASVTGDITLIAGAAPADHTPPSNDENLIAKYNATSGQRSYRLYIDTTGALGFTVSSDGTFAAGNNKLSTATTGFADGTYHWYRVSWAASTGTVTFYTSDDPIGTALGSISWVQLGDAVTTTATSIYDSAEPLEIGSTASGTSELFEGKISRAVVIASTDPTATPAVDFNAETAIADGWTIHSTDDAQLKTNKAMTFTEERTGPIALSTALAVDDGFNASSFLHGAVEAFPNLLPPAARVDFDEWTQTGTGSITPVGDGTELVTNSNFDDGTTGWTIADVTGTTVLTETAGVFRITNPSEYGKVSQAITTVVGETYVVNYEDLDYESNYAFIICSGLSTRGNELTPNGSTISSGYGSTWTFVATHTTTYVGIGNAFNTNSAWSEVSSFSVQKFAGITTLSDEDATASECRWSLDVTIPTDDETYQVPITLSEGTAAATDLEIRFSGTSTDINRVTHTWATGISTVDANQSGNTTINTAANSDGTVTLTMGMTDIAANTTISIRLFPATNDTSLQGTVNVHGDVVLNRVSVAAEPTWNTLRPGDSVEQHVLQQNDPNTTWTTTGSPVLTSGQADPRGGTDAFLVNDNAGGSVAGPLQNNLDFSASSGDTVRSLVWVKKGTDTSRFAGLQVQDVDDATTNYQVNIDDVNGRLVDRTGLGPDSSFIVDGAIIKALLPEYSDGENWWLVGLEFAAVSANNYRIFLPPAYASVFDGSVDANATGEATYYAPSAWIGDGYYFFDSMATTAAVTEVIQDWSKIFSYSTEASNNVVSIVFDHNYLEGAGVNIEGPRTNVLLQSNGFDTTWTNSAKGSEVGNYASAPDGSKTAWRLIDDSSGGTGAINVQQTVTLSNAAWTFSAYLKQDQLSWANLRTDAFTIGNDYTYFDLANGVVGTTSGDHDAGIELVGDGWYRCWVTFTPGADFIGAVYITVAEADNDQIVNADGTSSILIWGAQVEAGSFPSSYIKTEASSATRNADLLTYSAVGVADTFPMTQTLEVVTNHDFDANSSRLLHIDDGSADDRTILFFATGNAVRQFARASASTSVDQTSTATITQGAITAITGVFATNDTELYIAGTTDKTDTSATMPAGLTTIRVGGDNGSAGQPYANIRNVKIFDKRLTDAEVSKL